MEYNGKRDRDVQNGCQVPFFQSFYEKGQGQSNSEMPSLGDALAEMETAQQEMGLE